MEADKHKLAGVEWRNPAYIFREKSAVFTGRYSYDISLMRSKQFVNSSICTNEPLTIIFNINTFRTVK